MSWFWPILWSFAPVGELRVGLPLALLEGHSLLASYLVTVFANILVFPIFMFFLEFIHFRFLHLHHYRSAFDFFMERMRSRHSRLVEKWGVFAIFLLVAIPFPGTGAWTCTFVAWFFGVNKWRAFLALSAGMFVCGGIVLALSLGAFSLF